MGRVSAAIIAMMFVCGCEPRPAELSFIGQGDDWFMLNSATRDQLIQRTGGEYQISVSGESATIEQHTIRFTDDETSTLVSRFAEPALNRLLEFDFVTADLASNVRVISANERADATCHCNHPQTSKRGLVVDGAACPLPNADEMHVYDPNSGEFRARTTPLEAEERRWLLGLESSGRCARFLGTEEILEGSSASTLSWRSVTGLPRSSNLDEVIVAGGADALLVGVGADLRVQWEAGEEDGSWASFSLAGNVALSATSVPRGADSPQFWVLGERDDGELTRALLEFNAAQTSTVELASLVVHAELDRDDDLLFRRVSPEAIVARDVNEGLVLLADDAEHIKVETFALDVDPASDDVSAWAGASSARVFSTSAPESTWLAWSSRSELSFAWLMPVSGKEAATVFVASGVDLGELQRIVALDEDRIVLAFKDAAGLALWEWLQLPTDAEHAYDRTCERRFGSFCLRPFPTSAALDGRVSCASNVELLHAWATQEGNVALLYGDGHIWRPGTGCEQIEGVTHPHKVTSTKSGRTLIVDESGGYFVSTEEFRG